MTPPDDPDSVPIPHSQHLLTYARYIYPLVLFFFFIVSLAVWGIITSEFSSPSPPPVNGIANGRSKSRRNLSTTSRSWACFAARFPGGLPLAREADEKRLSPMTKGALNWLLALVILSFVANSAGVILHALTHRGWWCGKDYVISTIALLFIYALLLISQVDSKLNPSLPHIATWIVGLAGEVLVLALRVKVYAEGHPAHPGHREQDTAWGSWEIMDVAIDVSRFVLLFVLIGVYVCVIVLPRPTVLHVEDSDSEETTSLLGSGSAQSTPAGYGAASPVPGHPHQPKEEANWARRTVVPTQSWWEYLRGYTIFFPYLWPSKDRRLQVLMIVCFGLVLLQRGVNVLVPHQLGKVTDILSGENGEEPHVPWTQILLYITYRFLQGNMGVLGAMRSTLWIPIGQYSYQALSTSAFEHVHSLSLDFHLGKKTGEVLSALSKGNAINTFLEQVSFQVVPMLVDLAVAVGYFLIEFDAYYALIVAVVTFAYLYLTVRLAQWRADIRREMVNKSREEDAVKNDSMVAYETVKYFNAEDYEFNRYRNAVKAYQRAEYRVQMSLNVMNVTQNVVFTLGLLIACFLSAYQVTTGQIKVGRFVALLTYLAQLQGPLNFFGTFYRSIQSSMINSERMLELFKEKPTVIDEPHVKELTDCTGEIRFDDVHFSYDGRKPALDGLDFVCKPGTTTAFVGESGGGKTTVLRLFFRFYNVTSGAILVDGHDVRDISIQSLRQHVGVVPQDTVLFNESVMYNLRYANPTATDEDVYDACRAASIHDKIMSFPDGYNTRVGERGLRLSGGEKQRVAIARTILKNPKIIFLDEATAALDSETEQHIQSALKELSKGRTTLVIAHRLSTIKDADQIVVLANGRAVECGKHDELLERRGAYFQFVEAQRISAENDRKASRRTQPMDDDDDDTAAEDTPVDGAQDSKGTVGVFTLPPPSAAEEEEREAAHMRAAGQNAGGAIPQSMPAEETPKEASATATSTAAEEHADLIDLRSAARAPESEAQQPSQVLHAPTPVRPRPQFLPPSSRAGSPVRSNSPFQRTSSPLARGGSPASQPPPPPRRSMSPSLSITRGRTPVQDPRGSSLRKGSHASSRSSRSSSVSSSSCDSTSASEREGKGKRKRQGRSKHAKDGEGKWSSKGLRKALGKKERKGKKGGSSSSSPAGSERE